MYGHAYAVHACTRKCTRAHTHTVVNLSIHPHARMHTSVQEDEIDEPPFENPIDIRTSNCCGWQLWVQCGGCLTKTWSARVLTVNRNL